MEDADFRQGLGHPSPIQSPPGWTPSTCCYLHPHSTRAGEGVVGKSEAPPRISGSLSVGPHPIPRSGVLVLVVNMETECGSGPWKMLIINPQIAKRDGVCQEPRGLSFLEQWEPHLVPSPRSGQQITGSDPSRPSSGHSPKNLGPTGSGQSAPGMAGCLLLRCGPSLG